jgi:putative ATP-dependent endonuclease of OLD family
MHLQSLKLKDYRSFDDVEISFCPDLTIFVGENNGGKSNAIDAIPPLAGRREIICEPTDIRFGSGATDFSISATFDGLSVDQQGRFISAATDASLKTARFNLNYRSGAYRPAVTGGQFGASLEPGCQEMVRHVYLPPLRDAKKALASGNPTRILALLHHFLDGTDGDDLAATLARTSSHPILEKIDGAVDVSLRALTAGGRRQSAGIGFSTDEKLIDIARDLRFKLADHGVRLEDLRYSGHGYANLLYMAAIAVELEKVSNADLSIFLVEEPEARLHPQLQAAVLCFLEEQAEKSRKHKKDLGPSGELQIVVATHSPHLSAWVECRKLVVFKSGLISVPAAATAPVAVAESPQPTDAVAAAALGASGPQEADQPNNYRKTTCISLSSLGLSDKHRRKIDRYLDVTKSAVLFGGRVFLVEGIAEALLIPVFAKKFVLAADPERYRIFRSAVFVPIDGVDFEPYAQLLLTRKDNSCITDQLVVVTDGDKSERALGKTLAGEVRKKRLEALANKLGSDAAFTCKVNTYSLEAELFNAGNAALMKTIYLKLHRRSGSKWDAAAAKTGDDQAFAIQKLFDESRKGDLAQLLADEIDGGVAFIVPAYIAEAIMAIVQ